MHKKIARWFSVHEEEFGLFMWTVALLFLVRSSGIFLNNYAETAFLKRYGVEYMPIVNMINAVVTFFVMGLMTGFMTRLPGARLLARLFVFCGLSIAVIRAAIPFGFDLIYPVLFMLKSQYEVLLALLFWNLANDLFNTRQSKRLFPLITAGGVIGQILGSFATPLVARWLYLDNLLIVYMVTALSGAWVVQAMGRRYPTLLFQHKEADANERRTSMIEEFKTVLPMMKSSVLVKILVVLTFMPNVVIPIMNYQFNFAVNEQFSTEAGLIEFFSYFRGVLNIVSLVILLFVGKLYDRFGLPVALMFHPFNYLLVFITFLLRFDAVAAMYARMSANIIRTTINIPATAVVTGLFPESYRAMIRPFLRGTVVRIGLFLGSGLILLSDTLFHPRYLSLVAMPFVLAWAVTPFILKHRYAGILLDLLAKERIDFRSMETGELSHVFRDKTVQENLIRRFNQASGENRLWTGRLLRSIAVKDLDDHVLEALRQEQDISNRIGLIDLLSDRAGPAAVDAFTELINAEAPALAAAMIDAGHRMSPQIFAPFNRYVYSESSLPLEVKAHAVGSLHSVDQDQYGPIIEAWLASEDAGTVKAGLIAVGVCRDKGFADQLKSILADPANDEATLTLALESLGTIDVTGLNTLVVELLENPDARMRRAVLDVYQIDDEESLKKVIRLLGDESEDIARRAREKIRTADYQNSLRLIKSLSLPQKKVKEALLDLLADMAIKDLDVFRFVQFQARTCYQLTVQAQGIRRLGNGDLQQLLCAHLDERVWFALQTTLQVLGTQDRSGRMHRIARSIFSSDKRQRANSLEALDDILDKSLVRLLMPLLEEMDAGERIIAGQRLFPADVKEPSTADLFEDLLESRNWVTLTLALGLMRQMDLAPKSISRVEALRKHLNRHVSLAAGQLMEENSDRRSGQEENMQTASIPLTDKILYLKNIEIFRDLSINELAAVASVTEEAVFDQGEQVFSEGERGDTLYLVLDGAVAVIKDCNDAKEIELDSIGAGEYFGEMSLFGDDRRSATIRVKKSARFLTLNKQELQEIVREYPQIALHVCRVLSMRIRRLHGKISDHSC
ncbi:Npt1/Npt2 family nucleotide transporter [Desulfosarcina sp.]|uniref:Npt1/Npt2 family nucleotide transporter n=1 Tax=Desulfosarcina sp. TaxID=2027861 RepID=UPI003970CD52